MPTTAPVPDDQHPLLADQALLEDVLNAMFAKVNKVLNFPNPGLRPVGQGRMSAPRSGTSDRAMQGTGISAEDVLSEAFEELLSMDPDEVQSWGAMAVTVAERRALDARKSSGRGLRGTAHRPPLELVSADEPVGARDGRSMRTVLDVHADPFANPEEEYLALLDVLTVRDLAYELLGDRDRDIFLAIQTGQRTRQQLAEERGLTRQRIGQIYHAALARLESDPRYPYGTHRGDRP